MAKPEFITEWPLMEQLADGPVKENLREVGKLLEELLKVRDTLDTLANFSEETKEQTVTIANDTLSTFGCIIDSNVDTIFHHLDKIFESQETGGETQAQANAPPKSMFMVERAKLAEASVALNNLSDPLAELTLQLKKVRAAIGQEAARAYLAEAGEIAE